jgi:predicted TIM-barrel fold metal-dependent hydrolase
MLRIIDAHVHYWEPARPDRPWNGGGDVPGPPVSVEELLVQAAAAGVEQITDITLRLMGEDNGYALESAERYPDRVAAVFGRFDPRGDDFDLRLEALAAHPKFAGVRFTLFRPDEQIWFTDGTLDRFLAASARRGLAVAIFNPSPRALGRLAERHPECTILADHVAVDHRPSLLDPAIDAFTRWDEVLALAKLPNVYLKVSNLPELSRRDFPFDDMWPRVDELYATFGPGRLVWGSNYPPSGERATYAESVRFFTELPGIPPADLERIMGGNLHDILSAAGGVR